MNRNRREGLPSKKVWKHLDYAPHSFDGINLWDFIDHINDDEIGKLVNLCHTLLKPRGIMIVTSFEEQSAPSQINSFVMQDSYRLGQQANLRKADLRDADRDIVKCCVWH